MSKIKPKKVIKNILNSKYEKIEKMIKHYETITNIEERDKFEVLIDNQFEQLKYEIKNDFVKYTRGIIPYKYEILFKKYIENKKKKQFFGFPCVRFVLQEKT